MNWDIIQGRWTEFKGQFQSAFSKLTDSDLQNLTGKKNQVLGKIQQRYGIAKEEAAKKLNEWADTIH